MNVLQGTKQVILGIGAGTVAFFLASCTDTHSVAPLDSTNNPGGYESEKPTLTEQDLEKMPDHVRYAVLRMQENGSNLHEFAVVDSQETGLSKVSSGGEYPAYTPEEIFNMGNRVKAVYPKPGKNLCLNRPVQASHELSYEPGSKAVDGLTEGLRNKWCTGYISDFEIPRIEVSLDRHYYFDRWVVYGAKNESPNYYLRYYWLDVYNEDDKTWRTIAVYKNWDGVARVSDVRLSRQYVAKKVRLVVYYGDPDGATRVYEFQVYNSRGYTPMPGDILITYDPTPDHSGIVYNSTTTIEAHGGPGVHTDDLGKWDRNYDYFVMRVKNSTLTNAQGAAGDAYRRLGKPYNRNFFDYKTTGSFYCNSLVYRAWRSGGGFNLDTGYNWGYLSAQDLWEDNDTYTIYNK